MVWPFVAIALGATALGVKYGIRAIRKSDIQIPTARFPRKFFQPFSADKSGFYTPMSRKEAYKILNISPTASKEKIRESHKQLMRRNHPDNGGSTYVAAKVNEAKDLLLKK